MTYHLDTSLCVDALRGAEGIEARMRALTPDAIKVPSIVCAELHLGAEKSAHPEETRRQVARFLAPFEIVPFDVQAALAYARARADLERRGEIIGPNDLIVAATALANEGILVTRNVREFAKVSGLRCESWTGAGTA